MFADWIDNRQAARLAALRVACTGPTGGPTAGPAAECFMLAAFDGVDALLDERRFMRAFVADLAERLRALGLEDLAEWTEAESCLDDLT